MSLQNLSYNCVLYWDKLPIFQLPLVSRPNLLTLGYCPIFSWTLGRQVSNLVLINKLFVYWQAADLGGAWRLEKVLILNKCGLGVIFCIMHQRLVCPQLKH